MAQYMFLLYDSEEWYDNVTPDDWQQAMKPVVHSLLTQIKEFPHEDLEGISLEVD